MAIPLQKLSDKWHWQWQWLGMTSDCDDSAALPSGPSERPFRSASRTVHSFPNRKWMPNEANCLFMFNKGGIAMGATGVGSNTTVSSASATAEPITTGTVKTFPVGTFLIFATLA